MQKLRCHKQFKEDLCLFNRVKIYFLTMQIVRGRGSFKTEVSHLCMLHKNLGLHFIVIVMISFQLERMLCENMNLVDWQTVKWKVSMGKWMYKI